MNVWLRYLAIVVLIGNGFTLFWSLMVLGRMILLGSFDAGIDHLAINLALSLAAVVLAALIAAPGRRGVSLAVKVIAIPSVLTGGLGTLSGVLGLYTSARQPLIGLSTDRLAVDVLMTERAVQYAFFSACTLALAVLVLASRGSHAELKASP
jgi:hypothetical protein